MPQLAILNGILKANLFSLYLPREIVTRLRVTVVRRWLSRSPYRDRFYNRVPVYSERGTVPIVERHFRPLCKIVNR